MNAFAAQAILYHVKQLPTNMPENNRLDSRLEHRSPHMNIKITEKFALYAIVQMSEEERIRLFESLVGGRKILKRLSEIFDVAWADKP